MAKQQYRTAIRESLHKLVAEERDYQASSNFSLITAKNPSTIFNNNQKYAMALWN